MQNIKSLTKYFYCLWIVLFACSSATLAQERKIDGQELRQLIAVAADKRKAVPQRKTVSTTGFGADDCSETIYESGPNDTLRVVSTQKANGVEIKTETIRIGTTRYNRQKDGQWIKVEPRPSGFGLGGGTGSGGISTGEMEVTIEHLFLGTEKIDGHNTSHYRTKKKVTFTSDTSIRTRLLRYDYWFRDDGMLVRESHEDAFENSSERYKSVTEYKYDVEIKIVAPIP